MTKLVQRADAFDRNNVDHIGFAASFVLPGEDKRKFDELLAGLALEYAVQGPLEIDAVRTMAGALWRKQHLSVYALAAEARALYGHFFRFPNDQEGFRKYMALLLGHLITTMQAMFEKDKKHQELQESNQSDEDKQSEDRTYQEELKKDRRSLATEGSRMSAANELMQTAIKIMSGSCPGLEEEWKQSQERPVEDPRIYLAMMGALVTPECLAHELETIERLDDTIDRSLNRLMRLQAARKSSAPRSVSPLLQHLELLRKR
jgi:hypothetical protein